MPVQADLTLILKYFLLFIRRLIVKFSRRAKGQPVCVKPTPGNNPIELSGMTKIHGQSSLSLILERKAV